MVNIREFRKNLRKFEQFLSHQIVDGCCGISVPQCHCLLAIEDLEKTTIGLLAAYLKLDKSTLSRTVDSLVRIGYVDRQIDRNDRRSARITLTESGQRQAQDMHRVNDDYFLRVFDNIPNDNQGNVVRSFELFVDAISELEEEKEFPKNCCTEQVE